MSTPEWEPLLVNLGFSAGAALLVGLIAFGFGTAMNRHRVIDIAWGLGFTAVAVVSLMLSQDHGQPMRRWLITLLTAAWGLRLAVHIGWRSRGHDEDPRYRDLLSRAKGNRTWYAFRMVYLLQACLVWVISLPVQVAQYDPAPMTPWLSFGVMLWTTGMYFETVGDAQLARFRSNPANRGKVLQTGLWRYTRHPNYFGDACVWWGLYLLACGSWIGALTVISPALMTYFLAGKTGKPLMDKHLSKTRPGYAEYVRRTSGFIPRQPKP